MTKEQEIFREYNQDGLNELYIGVMLVLTAGLFIIPLLAGVFILTMLLFGVKIYGKGKQKITEPRLGYVKFKTESGKSILFGLIIFFAVIVAVTAIALVVISNDYEDSDNWYKMAPFFYGLVMIGPSAHLVEKSGLKQYWLIAAYAVSQGSVITLITINNDNYDKLDGLIFHLLIMGLVFLIAGIIFLLKFVKISVIEDE